MSKIYWHNEKRKLSDLTPFVDNPRTLSEYQHEKLKESLAKFDLAEIPAINTDNYIVAGHQRIKILSELHGPDHEIDVRVPNRQLSENEYKEYLIRSNANTGSWDKDILSSDWSLTDLTDWGLEDVPEFKENHTPKELELKGYNQVHVLLSFHPDKFKDVSNILDEIKSVDGIEYEQSAN